MTLRSALLCTLLTLAASGEHSLPLLAALPPAARLVLLGDKDQLASVEAGAVLGELCRRAQGGHYAPATLGWLAEVTGEPLDPALAALADPAGTPLDQAVAMLRHSHRFSSASGIGAALARAAAAAGAADSVAAAGAAVGLPLLHFKLRHGAQGGLGPRSTPKLNNWQDLYRQRWTWDKVAKGSHGWANCRSACEWDLYVKDGIVVREEQTAKYEQSEPGVPDLESAK